MSQEEIFYRYFIFHKTDKGIFPVSIIYSQEKDLTYKLLQKYKNILQNNLPHCSKNNQLEINCSKGRISKNYISNSEPVFSFEYSQKRYYTDKLTAYLYLKSLNKKNLARPEPIEELLHFSQKEKYYEIFFWKCSNS